MGAEAEMTMWLPDDYPSCSPPKFTLGIPRCGDLPKLCQELTCLFTPGEEVVYQCSEHFIAYCASLESIAQRASGAVVDVESGAVVSYAHAPRISKAERRAEEKARKMAEATILENMTFDEVEMLLAGYGDAHAAGVEEGWLHI